MTFQKQPLLFPHEVLAYLFNEVKLEVPLSERAFYWNSARERGEEWARYSAADATYHPLGLYGDAARLPTIYKTERVTGLFMNLVLFRPATVRCTRFLLWSADDTLLYKNRSTNTILRYVVWSLQWAYHGLHPSRGLDGRPIQSAVAGQWLTAKHDKFTVTELRGDWEWHRKIFRFRASWKATTKSICFRCTAVGEGAPGMRYYDIGNDSIWLREGHGVETFLSQQLKDKHLCSLFASHLCLQKARFACILVHILRSENQEPAYISCLHLVFFE